MSPSSKGPTDNRRAAARQPPTRTAEPRTAAGRDLLARVHTAGPETFGQFAYDEDRKAILAIEAEAAAPAGLDVVTFVRDFSEWAEQLETFDSTEDAYVLLSTTDRNIIMEQFADQARAILAAIAQPGRQP